MVDVILAVVVLIAGLSMGYTTPRSSIFYALFVALLMCIDMFIETREARARSRFGELILTMGAYGVVLFIGSIVGGTVGFIVRNPAILLYAFWLYALVATGYLMSRCCLGWHVGASGAVLLSFLAVGLLIQSFYSGNAAWLALFIVAVGMWWGADSWRRANGLALNE